MKTPIPSWPDVAPRLIAVASGREPADMVIKGGIWVNVQTRECLPAHDIAIAEGRIACIVPEARYFSASNSAKAPFSAARSTDAR